MGTTLKCEYLLSVGLQPYTSSLGVTVMEDIAIPRREECEEEIDAQQDAGGEETTGSNGCRYQPPGTRRQGGEVRDNPLRRRISPCCYLVECRRRLGRRGQGVAA